MAEQIKINTVELVQISAQLKQIEKDVQETKKLINSARNNLDWKVSSKEEIDGILGTIDQALFVNQDKLSNMSDAVNLAVTKSEDYNKEVEKWVSAITTSIIGVIGGFAAIGKISVINMITGMKDTLTRAILKPNGKSSGGGGNGSFGGGSGGGFRGGGSRGDIVSEASGTPANSDTISFQIRKYAPGFEETYYSNAPGHNPYPAHKPTGNCTWYAYGRAYELYGDAWKNRVGDIDLGNAKNWYKNLSDLGFEVGSEPKPGAIAIWGDSNCSGAGHVAIVEEVTSDGSVVFSESNYGGTWYLNKGDCTEWPNDKAIYNYYGNSTGYWGTLLSKPEDIGTRTQNGSRMGFVGYVYVK